MSEAELYKELGALTKEKDRWEESIPNVSSLLTHDSMKIQAKALWLLPGSRFEIKDGLYHGEYSINHPEIYVKELLEI